MHRKAPLFLVPVVVVALGASACGSSSSAASGGGGGSSSGGGNSGTENVTLMVGGLDKIIYLPAMLAQQLGYFKTEGLNVKLLNTPANGGGVVDTVLTGDADAAVSFFDHSVDLAGLGKSTESVVILDTVPGEAILVPKKNEGSITSVSDFKGKTLGVTSLGGSGEFLTRYLVQHAGLSQSDVKIIGAGAGAAFIATMDAGRVDAGLTTEPSITKLTTSGSAKVLVDLRSAEGSQAALGGIYPGGAVYTSTDYATKHPQTIQKFVNAFVKTLAWIHTHTAEQIADKMPSDYYGSDKGRYVQALEASLPMFNPTGLMPQGGPETVLKVLSTFDPNVKGKNIDLSKTWTDKFVQAAGKAS